MHGTAARSHCVCVATLCLSKLGVIKSCEASPIVNTPHATPALSQPLTTIGPYAVRRLQVIDEADTMFAQGWGEEVQRILEPLSSKPIPAQIVLVSATMTKVRRSDTG